MKVSISRGNEKLGSIQSVSLPSGLTCRECDCSRKCYARRIERRRPSVAAAIMLSRFFRFHVSGDIPNTTYFHIMMEVAKRNSHCEILCFTKKYEIVNEVLASGIPLPSNLHMIFSAWKGLRMDNPFQLPEAHVRYKDGTTTARSDAKECGGNCTECACTSGGCWSLHTGEQVVFNEH